MPTRLLRRVRLCDARTFRLAPALVAFLALSVFVPAATAGTLDQSQPNIRANVVVSLGDVFHGAQTFTSGMTGGLYQVALAIGRTGSFVTASLIVEIRPVSGGVPSGPPLATATVPAANVPVGQFGLAFLAIHFASPAPVTAGVQYAIVVSSESCGFSNCYSAAPGPAGDSYAAGSGLGSSNAGATWTPLSAFGSTDFAFQTYVLTGPTSKQQCKKGGWKQFTNPSFTHQGRCVAYVNHHNGKGKDDEKQSKPPKGHGRKK